MERLRCPHCDHEFDFESLPIGPPGACWQVLCPHCHGWWRRDSYAMLTGPFFVVEDHPALFRVMFRTKCKQTILMPYWGVRNQAEQACAWLNSLWNERR